MFFKLLLFLMVKQSLSQVTLNIDQITTDKLDNENFLNQNRHVILVACINFQKHLLLKILTFFSSN